MVKVCSYITWYPVLGTAEWFTFRPITLVHSSANSTTLGRVLTGDRNLLLINIM